MNKLINKHFIIGVVVIVCVSLSIYGYYKYNELYPSTDDAYVNANIVNVSPKVGGYIKSIDIVNDQLVHRGDLLFTIDSNDYDLSKQQSSDNYVSMQHQVDMINKQILVANSTLKSDQEQFTLLKTIAKRYSILFKAHTISKEVYDNAINNLNKEAILLKIDSDKIAQMKSAQSLMISKQDAAHAALALANSNVSYTKYYAPNDGYIANLNNLSVGELVSPGQQLFSVVNSANWWIDANFKETDLSRIKVGQIASVSLDMYGSSHKYLGQVISVSRASGNTFSLLPAQNATGNWVKVTQRFTVRVALNDSVRFPLRVGSSAIVTIDTTK